MSSDNPKSPVFERAFLAPRFWPTWLLLGFFWLIAQLPVRLNQAVGYGLGWLLFYLAPARRRIAAINIEYCFPELDARARDNMVRGVIYACGLSFAETAMGLWGAKDKMRGRYELTGLEHIENALAEGKGVLLMGSHLTTIDISGLIMSYHIKADVLYRSDPNPLMSYAIAKARSRVNDDAIQRNDTRKLIKNLRMGHIVWYAPDQDYGAKHSVFAPFFGIQAATVVATSRIAKLSGAAVIPFFCYREAKGRFRLVVQPPLDNFPSGDDVADATRVNRILEDAIRVAPDQYLWVHRRFKTRPEGEPGFYPHKKRSRRRAVSG
ncbi:LpxL/LpxP family Kdo(2)-lipid IV(A) lauroyl/palmitoleoyl acyltransferase [Cellvibrio japonicus]|uniref:Lipid A biosynthesis acyltransferase n=1 Tax=Cellvibrio japonicus (strain Ueda107) TaxID=498211 RepID=B3PC27_CELJU|nr:LpxL/LpxP family Kdo(2)-lipid IV(A) lauroyl/palmitoleoyl acyltransferase [Cellvibrio japonicus]ACE85026.1 lipid A biosynthesis lauroyl acyltransferase [Cellvibrio japonicus Ueda107]QEI13179.1 LpxL/LpxP family Kdo(2)-lipid IV(A) lauroyl/palmitoleoyl acyltransferase [Cellvibrio japonicus]QEI16753.1 LpxL/LpxP family Kdo(2)-lipid IV(A) lauroyl/palmitoleoyl acyltransferase [Cellvibrio japonicus]QEI20331.1 LpxL/LpxP family Kdo(2)-lipid IV(A) lauroyl/palmitoleoyl acyltransferase [Cellvibrio japonic